MLKVIEVNCFQESDDDSRWYDKIFVLSKNTPEDYSRWYGCSYESDFRTAKSYGIEPSDLRKGQCSVRIYSKKDGVWL